MRGLETVWKTVTRAVPQLLEIPEPQVEKRLKEQQEKP